MNFTNKKNYQVCKRCLMDTSAANIVFNNGICNYCENFLTNSSKILFGNSKSKKRKLKILIDKIKIDGKNKKYDCIIGVSGGVDSSWVLIKAISYGLRPLAVHMDNGWNSELTQNNIANIVTKLGVDLYTHVIDWDEYRNLMQSFFEANVLDVELLYDNAMLAVNYEQAHKYGVKYILSGTNTSTEGMRMPENWNWYKYDKKNILAIAKRFGNVKTKTFPFFSTLDYVKYEFLLKIKWLSMLDLLEYNKYEAIEYMSKKYNFKPYPFKHYESIFTRFYQGFILPNKFNIDKRRLHLSTLVISGQISRNKALKSLDGIAYNSNRDLTLDTEYFLKKMKWSKERLNSYIKEKQIPHLNYGSEIKLYLFLHKIRGYIKKII